MARRVSVDAKKMRVNSHRGCISFGYFSLGIQRKVSQGRRGRIAPRFYVLWEYFMNKRLGFVGVVIENRQKSAHFVNDVLSEFGELIVARTGVPYKEKQCSVITLIVDATTDELGTLTGKLGQIESVSVKSSLSKV